MLKMTNECPNIDNSDMDFKKKKSGQLKQIDHELSKTQVPNL